MRRVIAVLYLSLFVLLLLGCEGPSASDRQAPLPDRDEVFDAARIVCDGDGARVLTPKVEAQPDGVHLVLDNRLTGNADYSIDHPGGGEGWNVPPGESERVANTPPGSARIDCYRRSWRGEVGGNGPQSFEVVAGDSGYKSTKLDCPRAKSGRIKPYSEEEMQKQKGDPVEIFRRGNSGSLREGDVVEVAGYPKNQDERTVRVVRDGKVVATAHYLEFSTGWLEATEENCAEF